MEQPKRRFFIKSEVDGENYFAFLSDMYLPDDDVVVGISQFKELFSSDLAAKLRIEELERVVRSYLNPVDQVVYTDIDVDGRREIFTKRLSEITPEEFDLYQDVRSEVINKLLWVKKDLEFLEEFFTKYPFEESELIQLTTQGEEAFNLLQRNLENYKQQFNQLTEKFISALQTWKLQSKDES